MDDRIDKVLERVSKQLHILDFVLPVNDSSEKKRFLGAYRKGDEYNPQFKYKRKGINFEKINKMLDSLQVSSRIHSALIGSLRNDLAYINLLSQGVVDRIYPYGIPESRFVDMAKSLITSEKSPKKERPMSAKEAREKILDALRSYGFEGWSVKIRRRLSARAEVDAGKKILKLKARKFSADEVERLITHEIEGHVMRAMNGKFQPFPILGVKGMPGYLHAEEGLAAFLEEIRGVMSPNIFRFICAREIAVSMAMTESFYTIFRKMHEEYNFSADNSYRIAKRAKRGLEDTSRPGGFIKDHVYFEGLQKIREFVAGGNDLRLLFAGKIGFEDIPLVEKGVLERPKFLPRWLNNRIRIMNKERENIQRPARAAESSSIQE